MADRWGKLKKTWGNESMDDRAKRLQKGFNNEEESEDEEMTEEEKRKEEFRKRIEEARKKREGY